MADFEDLEPVIPATPADGQLVSGAPAGARAGQDVAFLGDVNGDGLGDYALVSDVLGQAWLIYGKTGGAAPDLTNLGPGQGQVLTLGVVGDLDIAALGDINGDGFADVALSAPSPAGKGAVQFFYGGAGVLQAGLTLTGETGDGLGTAVAAAGDLNGDGLGDVIFGRPGRDSSAGGAAIVFGRTDSSAIPTFAALTGAQAGSLTGYAVSSAGDINGDGFDDLLIGAPKAAGAAVQGGSAYVVFGHGGAWGNIDLSALDGTNGFRIDGNYDHSWLGAATAVGDINGDGLSDLFIGSPALDDTQYYGGGRSGTYVILGHRGPFDATLNLADRTGADAFRMWGYILGDEAGRQIAVGDFNGDGLDDLATFMAAGMAYDWGYVLFGKQTPFGIGPTPSASNGRGIFIDGEFLSTYDFEGQNPSIALGDINGDGADDLIIGLPGLNGDEGGVAIRYGQATDVTRTGTAGADYLISGAGGDILLGLAGKDQLIGGFGDDLLDGGADNDVLHAGAGADIVTGGLGADLLYGEDGDDTVSGGDGADKLFGDAGSDTLTGGAGADRIEGGAGNDVLNGGADNDHLDGGVGADSMTGGAGNDVFLFDDAGDTAVEQAGGGYDIVRAFATITLSANVEALQLQGSSALDGTGNAEANNLAGNSGANRLSGLAGVDTIDGGDGSDVIVGGTGNDLLRGGTGADRFVVLGESLGTAVLETDQIFDFSTLAGDRLDLSGIDANPWLNGDQAFRLVSALSRHDAAHPELTGQMTLSFAAGVTLMRLDVNGDGRADYQLKINGDVTGDSGGWLL